MAGEVIQPEVQSLNASRRLIVPITFGPTTASGTSTASGATTLTDGGASWTVNGFAGLTVYSNGSSAVVVSNTSTVITVASWTGGTPTAVKPYQIAAAGINGPMGTVTVGTISASGIVMVRNIFAVATTGLTAVSTASRLSIQATGSAAGLFISGVTDAATYATGKIITVTGGIATGGYAPTAPMKDTILTANIDMPITGENILTGVLTVYVYWDPISSGATLT